MNIDKNKIVFVTLDWMKFYKGITDNDVPLGSGGSYPKDQKHDIYNFLEEDGKCYGFTPPWGKLNLKRICKSEIKIAPDGYQYIENVLVVFNGSNNDGRKRRVIGFYVDATIYNKIYESKNPNRIIKSNNTFVTYNVVTKAENAYLIDEVDRNIELPFSKIDGYGYGQHNLWYAPIFDSRIKDYRNNIITEIKKIIITHRKSPPLDNINRRSATFA